MNKQMMIKPRNRIVYSIATLIVIVIGFLSRQIENPITELFGKYPGDVLWGLMLFLAFGTIMHHLSTVRLALLTMTAASIVEISQLYHADWIDAIRMNIIGHAILGSSFSLYDIAAYGIGIVIGSFIDRFITSGGFPQKQ